MIAVLGLKKDLRDRKILERHRKGFNEETPEQTTELTREKVDSHGQNIWEVSTDLWKIFVLVDLGEIFDQAVKYFKVRFAVSEYKYFLSQMTTC